MSEFQIKRAERQQARLRLAFQGPSGSGKTATSLLVAKGIIEAMVESGEIPQSQNPRIGLIDTERRSASLYSHIVPFDVIDLDPPYTTHRYIGALQALERAGYPVIIIDQISHEWAGKGGVLQQVDQAQQRGGNQMAAWIDATPVHDEFVDSMLRVNAHLIVTMRSKTSWELVEETDRRGQKRKVPKRIGMAPVQRPGIEYEFTTLLALDTEGNRAQVLKDRTVPKVFGEINAITPRLGETAGHALVAWMKGGAAMEAADFGSGTPQEQAIAKSDAAIRNCQSAPTAPDLARIYEAAMAMLRSYAGMVDLNELNAHKHRIIQAKDKRKLELGAGPRPVPTEDVISPDGAALIEEMLRQGGIPAEQFCTVQGVQRIALLPLSHWQEAQDWIGGQAANNGRPLASRPHPVHTPPPPPATPVERILGTIDSIGERKAGGSLFSTTAGSSAAAAPPPVLGSFADFKDDIPY